MTDTPIQTGIQAGPERTAPERVAKVISRSGVASRRDAEKMILEGRVAVNGKTIASPALDIGPKDKVTIDGKPIDAPQETRLWVYYKPLGLVTTEKDEQGRRTIFDEMPAEMPRVLNVGRLDLNSEGLLLLTNDGGLKRRLEHPETAWLRKYRVRVNGRPMDDTFRPLREGITIDGEDFQPMDVTLDRQQGANAWLTIGIREGKNREIRRAMSAIGLTVNRLIRVSYGPFRLNEMQPGDVIELKRKVIRDQLGDRLLTGAEDGREPLSERMPRRGPPRGGPREGAARGDAKPRSSGFRSHRDEAAGERPDFGKKPYEKREGDRPGYAKKSFEDRGERPARSDKPFEKREGFARKSADDRGDRKPYAKRDGDKPGYAKKSFEDRGERPARSDKPYVKREGFARKSADDRGDRKPYAKRDGDKPGYAKKSFEDRGERPARSDKPYEKREGFARKSADDRGDRKPYAKRDGDKPGYAKKSYEDRGGPAGERKPFARREEGGERPARAGVKSAGFKSSGFKSEGFKSHGPKGKPRAEGFKSHRDGADGKSGSGPRRPGGKPSPKRD